MRRSLLGTNPNLRFFILWVLVLLLANCLIINYFAPFNTWYRYYGVAFQMWHTDHFWYPIWQDNAINLQKGPLLYWLVLFSWKLFGLIKISPFVLIGISYLAIAYYTYKIANFIFNDKNAAVLALFCFACNTSILLALQEFQFDIVLTACFIASLYYLLTNTESPSFSIGLFAIAVMLGILTKGPVFLFFLSTTIILMSWLNRSNIQRLKNMLFIVLALIIALLFAALYVIIVNHKTHGLFFHGLWHQTLQRFDLNHPNPSRGADFTQHLTWIQLLSRPFIYTSFFLLQNLLFILLFFPQIIKGWRFLNTSYGKLFFISFIITVLFFGLCVGQFEMRYIYPITPLANLLVVGCVQTCGMPISEKQWRALKFVLLGLFCYFVFLPFTAMVWLNQPSKLFKSQHLLQNLVKEHIPIIVVSNDKSNFSTGWPRFLAHDTKIFQISTVQFAKEFPNPNNNSWCVMDVSVQNSSLFQHQYLLNYPGRFGDNYETNVLIPCNSVKSSQKF